MTYRVIQITEGKQPTVWCTADDFKFLCKFCQYHIDSCIPEGLDSFWVFETKDPDDKGFEVPERKWKFLEFCEQQGIRKRTFEERMKDA